MGRAPGGAVVGAIVGGALGAMVGTTVGAGLGGTPTGVGSGVIVAATGTAAGESVGRLVEGAEVAVCVGGGAVPGTTVGAAVVRVGAAEIALALVAACGAAHAPRVDAMRTAAISRRMSRG